MTGPLLDAALPELPLLVADEHRAFGKRALGEYVGIVHLKPHHLQLVLDVARQDELQTFELFRKQVEHEAPIDVPRDLLSEIRGIAEGMVPIDEAGHAVPTPIRGGNNRSAIVEGNVAQTKRNPVPFEHALHGEGEWGPGKLNSVSMPAI